jgi:hypothetical protein
MRVAISVPYLLKEGMGILFNKLLAQKENV